MWVNVCEMDYLEALVDASPLRYGKLMPGTHTPIVSPEEFGRHQPGLRVRLGLELPRRDSRERAEYAGYWIVPLPEMRIE